MKKNKKLIVIAVAMITLYQVFSTISLFIPKTNIQMIYEVKPGEDLQIVACKFNTTTERLEKLNNVSSYDVGPGMRLKID